ncbi:acylphosphatase [Rhodocista pekingensis]|uniref:acylphosphatase n=1 Tax=Rhodocista pekingensis TaxID=201185 RepID=A0ABW2KQ70_9PROT
MSGGRTAVLARITGRVQGVGYRAWTVRRAAVAGLDGWVRNRADGSVEALFVGPAAAVQAMLTDCGSGPPAALVAEVRTEPAVDPGATGFGQRPTA